MTYPESDKVTELLDQAQRIVIIQADNPDGDSLGSALALEHILGEMGKEPALYCGVAIPTYLRYLPGWDRVENELPRQFDLSIVVDTSTDSLLETLTHAARQQLQSRPCIVLDHHTVELHIPFATLSCNHTAVATGEIIYELAQQCSWPLNLDAKEMITTAIMADSLGLTTEATTARSIHIIGELVEGGVSIAGLEHKRRLLMRKEPSLVHYKGELLQRVAYSEGNRIATVVIPWKEIERYSPFYNPSMLVMEDMRLTTGTQVAIAFKVYKDGKVTAKIRCNQDAPVAAKLAERFGGGGHMYASGFKLLQARPIDDVQAECIAIAGQLLAEIKTT